MRAVARAAGNDNGTLIVTRHKNACQVRDIPITNPQKYRISESTAKTFFNTKVTKVFKEDPRQISRF
jgi:hypothetical protein